MNVKVIAALAAGLLSAAPAMASNVTIDFEGVTSFDPVGSLYEGLGVTFGLDAIGYRTSDVSISGAPSPLGVMSPLNGGNAALSANPVTSFIGTIAFFYSSLEATTVSVWSGANGTGTKLGTIDLAANASSDGCIDAVFCHWNEASLSFAGAARSIMFGDATGGPAIDNITLNAVPLPAAVWLLLSALGGFGTILRRKRVG
jgi:hypothetical protein